MIDVVLWLVFFFIIVLINPAVGMKVFKEQVCEYVLEKLKEQQKHEQLRRDMKQRKKGNQGKTILK